MTTVVPFVNPAGDTPRTIALRLNQLIKNVNDISVGPGIGTVTEVDTDASLFGGPITTSGTLGRAALTGDITAAAGSNATTLATVNSNIGAFTNANVTVNAKGQVTAAANGSGGYTDEQAQDAVGAMVDASLTYVDATPLLQRAALTGDVTASAGSNATTIANAAVTYAKIQNVTDARLLGRSSGSAGPPIEITAGTGLSLSGGALTATASPTGNTLSAEILADAPTAYWKCDDTSGSTIVDSSGGGFNLTVVGTPTLAYTPMVPTETASFLRIKATTDGASLTSALGTSPPLSGDLSFGCIVTPEALITNHVTVFSLGLNSSETEANNIQFYFYFDISNSGRATVFWENGAGTDTNVAIPSAAAQLPVTFRAAFWHVVKDGTAKTVTFYRNGVLMGAPVSYTNNPTGGTGSIQARIGYDGTLSTGVFQAAHIAFYNGVKLSQARVWAQARAAGLAGNV